jgi:hypothetical protein
MGDIFTVPTQVGDKRVGYRAYRAGKQIINLERNLEGGDQLAFIRPAGLTGTGVHCCL